MSNLRFLSHKSHAVYEHTVINMYLKRLTKLSKQQRKNYLLFTLCILAGVAAAIFLPFLITECITLMLSS